MIPADFSLRHLDLELADLGKPRKQLEKALIPVADDYDVVFIDCPPGITLTIESVLRATDVVLVPVVPAVLPFRAFDQLASYVRADRKVGELKTVAFLSMVDRRKRAHRELVDASRPTPRRSLDDRPGVGPGREHASAPRPARGRRRPDAPAVAYRALWSELQARAS